MKLRALFAGVLLALALVAGAQVRTYMALGDSVAFGYQPNNVVRSAADQGYVRLFADWLGVQNGGTRPRLINLAIPGETSASFFNTSEAGGFLNSNYPILFRSSQSSVFGSRVNSELSAGRVVTDVTFVIGANDLLDLLTPAFLAQPFATQQAQADAALAAMEPNLVSALTRIRQFLPNARLVVPGYYNPYGAFPTGPENRIGQYAIPRLNTILRNRASQFNARFVETLPWFVGRELTLTWIGENDVHPRDPGYSEIFRAMVWRVPVRAPVPRFP